MRQKYIHIAVGEICGETSVEFAESHFQMARYCILCDHYPMCRRVWNSVWLKLVLLSILIAYCDHSSILREKELALGGAVPEVDDICLLYTSPSPRD